MYLEKIKKGFSERDTNKIWGFLQAEQRMLWEKGIVSVPELIKKIKESDWEKVTGIKYANELKDDLHNSGESFTWLTVEEKVAYWRKENAIHNWFVNHVQNGVDDCGYYKVTENDIEELLKMVTVILLDRSKADEILPTVGGFFFGDTNYDDCYFEGLKNTKNQLQKALKVDFYRYNLYYHSSW